jgi:hypothetical protein
VWDDNDDVKLYINKGNFLGGDAIFQEIVEGKNNTKNFSLPSHHKRGNCTIKLTFLASAGKL